MDIFDLGCFRNFEGPSFEGKLKKIHLVTSAIGMMGYNPGDEIEQKIILYDDGKVSFFRYRAPYDSAKYSHELITRKDFRIQPEAIETIMSCMTKAMTYEKDASFIEIRAETGAWKLTLTNTDNVKFKYYGELYIDVHCDNMSLSEIIRNNLHSDDMWVFDGNPDKVVRVEINYQYKSLEDEELTELAKEGIHIDHATERLIVDRKLKSAEYIRENFLGNTIVNSYSSDTDIDCFLDDIDVDMFSEIQGDPIDVIENENEHRIYKILIYTRQGKCLSVEGTYDKNNLPEDWSTFITDAYTKFFNHGTGDLFDKNLYGMLKRRKSDYIYCDVAFNDYGRTYCYLADTDDYKVGDSVVVPAGRDNHESVVKIKAIKYYSTDNVPYPLHKMKHIIRKHTNPPMAEKYNVEAGVSYKGKLKYRKIVAINNNSAIVEIEGDKFACVVYPYDGVEAEIILSWFAGTFTKFAMPDDPIDVSDEKIEEIKSILEEGNVTTDYTIRPKPDIERYMRMVEERLKSVGDS